LIDYKAELDEKSFGNVMNVFHFPFGSVSTYHLKTFEDCVYWNPFLKNVKKENRYTTKIVLDK
jgi:hypothetical protein